MGPAPSSADQLIEEAAAGLRRLTAGELRFVLEHVAQAGFDPAPTSLATGLAGMVWQGRTLRGRDRITPAERHYLEHVIVEREWPVGTTLDAYLNSIRAIVLDPSSGVFSSYYRERLQLSIIRHSGALKGPSGYPWVLVEYRVDIGYWVTAFQPIAGIDVFIDPARRDAQWLRHPL